MHHAVLAAALVAAACCLSAAAAAAAPNDVDCAYRTLAAEAAARNLRGRFGEEVARELSLDACPGALAAFERALRGNAEGGGREEGGEEKEGLLSFLSLFLSFSLFSLPLLSPRLHPGFITPNQRYAVSSALAQIPSIIGSILAPITFVSLVFISRHHRARLAPLPPHQAAKRQWPESLL